VVVVLPSTPRASSQLFAPVLSWQRPCLIQTPCVDAVTSSHAYSLHAYVVLCRIRIQVLVTHRVDLLRHLPYIVVLGDKGVTAQGSYHELVAQGVDMGIHDSDTASTGSAEAHVQESLSEHAKDAGAVASDAAPDSREHHEASARAQLSWCDAALVDVSRDADVSREVEVRAGAKAERMSGERVGTAAEVGGKGGAGGVAEEGSDGVHRRGSEDILKREHPFQRRASDDSETQRHGPAEEGKMIIQEEERETGLVNPATYRSYFSSVGQQMMVAVMLFGAGSQIAHVLTGWCIAAWASDDSLLPGPLPAPRTPLPIDTNLTWPRTRRGSHQPEEPCRRRRGKGGWSRDAGCGGCG
jgi:hypothetical protein